MRKPILIVASAVGAAVLAFGIYLSQVGTSAPANPPENSSTVTESPQPSDERAPDETNDQDTGKPGEVKD